MEEQKDDTIDTEEKKAETLDSNLEPETDEEVHPDVTAVEEVTTKIKDIEGNVIAAGHHNGDNITIYYPDNPKDKSAKKDRKGLPSKFYKGSSQSISSYGLKNHADSCKELVTHQSLSLITCADENMLQIIADSLADEFESDGYQVMQMLFENYDLTSVDQLVHDIIKRNFKWQGKLLLYIRDAGTYGKDQPPSIRDINKIQPNQATIINGRLTESQVKIVYLSSNTYSKRVFRAHHIDFLEPFLTYHNKLAFCPIVKSLRSEGRIPKSDLELLGCLNASLQADDFEIALKCYEVNKKIFIEGIKEGGIKPYVLFVGTFFRGLEFDEFQMILFLLIDQIESKKKSKKLKNEWNKKADSILERTSLNKKSETNFRLIDFNQETDAESCKNVLISQKRIFVDKLANIISSTSFFFYKKFRASTVQKINVFIVTFGKAYGRYYEQEVPFQLLEVIADASKQAKKKQRLKIDAQLNYLNLKQLLERCKNLKGAEIDINFFRGIHQINLKNSKLDEMLGELHFMKYILGKELELSENFDLQETINELRILKHKAHQLLEEYNADWNTSFTIKKRLIRRFSLLLIEMELDTNSSQVVDSILDEAIKKEHKYTFIFDILNELNYRSEKSVIQWYVQSLSSTKKNERENAFMGMWDLLYVKPTDFFKLFFEIDKNLNYNIDEASSLEKHIHFVLFLNLDSLVPKNDEDDAPSDFFHESIFNTDPSLLLDLFPRLVKLLLVSNFKETHEELFPDNERFESITPDQIVVLIFFHWYNLLTANDQKETVDCLIRSIKSNLETKQSQRKLKEAIAQERKYYNFQINQSEDPSTRKKFKEKRNQFVQFKNLIQ